MVLKKNNLTKLILFLITLFILQIFILPVMAETISTHNGNISGFNIIGRSKATSISDSNSVSTRKVPLKTTVASKKYMVSQVKSINNQVYKADKRTVQPYKTSERSIIASNYAASSPVQKQSSAENSSTKTENIPSSTNSISNTTTTDNYKLNLSDYADQTPLSEKIRKQGDIKEPSFLSLVSSLFIVIVLVIAFGWIYGRMKGIDTTAIIAAKLKGNNDGKFNIISTACLGQGKTIHLVEIKGKQLVIGSTNNNINLLTELKPGEEYSYQEKLDLENESPNEDTSNLSDTKEYGDIYPEIYKEYLNRGKEKS